MGLLDRLRSSGRAPVDEKASHSRDLAEEAMRLLEQGIALENAGLFEQALAQYDRALRLAPELARAHFNRGNVLLELGNSEAAAKAYSYALQFKPDSAAAHYNLGRALAFQGLLPKGIDAFEKAIKLKPDFVDAHVALGVALADTGQIDDAIAAYRRALDVQPDYGEVHYNLGSALTKAGKFEEAVRSLHRATQIKTDYADAHSLLGDALLSLDRFDEAIASYRQALTIRPADAEDNNNQGVALQNIGLMEAAVENYRRAVALAPSNAKFHDNLGTALKRLGRLDEALTAQLQAVALNPEFAEAHNNLGAVQYSLRQLAEAMASYRKAIEINPDCFDAYNNLGVAQQQTGQLNAAIENYRRALEINPDFSESHNNLGSALAALGNLAEAAVSYRRALEIKPDFTRAYSNLLFVHNYLADQSATELLTEAKRFGILVASKARAHSSWPNSPNPGRSLRVGIVSGDLRQHPVGYFVESVLEAFVNKAPSRLEFFAYSNYFEFDTTSERIRRSCANWFSILGLTDEIVAQQIRDDRIDILIDIAGHTGHNRLPLFAWKPAPVQVSWLGYFATTGVAAIDYLIADPWTLPETEEANFTETIWRLPETRLCFTPPDLSVAVTPLPALERGYVTFGNFNNLAKMNDDVVALWARILNAVPNSRLSLKTQHFNDPAVQENVFARFEAHGINRGRLVLEGYAPRADYLTSYNHVDIALDPFPYTGGTTTVEALWMGVPVLTLAGKQFLARQGVGLLVNAGLPDWVASDSDDYFARAVAHASDLQNLASLRDGLRQQLLLSPVCDAQRFAQNFETALRSMWERWCQGQQIMD